MKKDFGSLDASIIEILARRSLLPSELLSVAAVRDQAFRLNVRRAGVSPSASADKTIIERLQALRRSGKIAYDSATSRWDYVSA
jgi:hypothetical protein